MADADAKEKSIFLHAMDIASVAERAAYLQTVCAGNDPLRHEIEALLRAHAKPQGLLDAPDAGSPTVDQPLLEKPGAQIGPYKLLQEIGQGGMGIVYMAEQKEPVKRRVALKIIKPGMDTRQVIARFEVERQTLSLMDHPNIARVLDAGSTGSGRPYFVMELVKGQPITEYCDQQHLTPRQRLELFLPVCHAIQHAHQKGIIHRDIKPSNVLVAEYDGRPLAKVIDFGVAKAISQPLTEKTMFTAFGQVVGTLEYMSPEQARVNQLDIDTRSDIYSLGVLLYELLTGSTPFDKQRFHSAAWDEMLRIIREEEPPKPSTRLSASKDSLPAISSQRQTEPAKLAKLVRGELDWIVMKALEKDRSRRYETANGFAMDVQRYLADEPVQACPPSAGYRLRKFARRNKGKLALGLTAAVAVLLALVGLVVSNILITQEKDQKVAALKQAKINEDAANQQKRTAEKNAAKAKEQERLAAANAATAKANESVAKANEELARRRFYAAQMHLAMQAWESGEAHRVLALLESLRPKIDEEDLRTFEWYYLWRLCQGTLRRTFPMLQFDNGAAMALSADGQTLASGFGETIKLWDTRTGLEKRSLTGHATMVEAMAFTADGKTLVSSDTLTIRTWDIPSGKEVTVITTGRTGTGQAPFAITADGKTLVLGGPQLNLWDLTTAKQTGEVTSGAGGPYIPSIASDGQTIAARCGSDPYVVKIWTRDGESWRERHSIQAHSYFFTAAFSPDSKTLAVSGGQVKCYDVATGELRFAVVGHNSHAWSVAFSGDGKSLITSSFDKTARLWDAATGRQIACLAHPQPVYGAALSADGKVAATASRTIRIWDTTPPHDALALKHAARVGTVAISGDGAILASAGADETRLWSLDSLTEQGLQITGELGIVLSLPGPAAAPPRGPCLALSRDGQTLAVPEPAAQNIGLWSATGKKLAVLEGHDQPVARLAMSPDGKRLASISDSPVGILWDLTSRKPLAKFRILGALSAVAFSPDGKILAVGSQFGAAKLFEAATGREIATLQRFELATDWTEALAFSADSTLVAVSSQMGNVQVWEVATGRLHAAFSSHDKWGCGAFAFSPDSRTLAIAGHDATVKFWDVITGQERCTLKGHQGPIRSMTFTSDGAFLITGSDDGDVRLWPAAMDTPARARKTEFDIHAPLTPAALNEQGDNLWQYDHTEEAERAYAQSATRLKKLAANFADSPEHKQEMIRNLLSRSQLLDETGRPDEAKPLRERAHQLYRDLSANDQQLLIWAYSERGRKQSGIQNLRQAERTFDQLFELEPTNNQARRWRRWNSYELGNWENVVEDSTQLIAQNPDVASHWNWRGFAYRQLGQNDKALADYSRAVVLAPDNAIHWSNRGACYDAVGQYDKAIADLSQAIKLNPNQPLFHFRLGEALERAGKPDESLQSYRKAIALGPKDVDLRNQLIQSLHRRRAALDERALSSLEEPWDRWKLATDYFQLAVNLRDLEEFAESEALCRQSLKALLTLAEEDPQEIQFDYDIGWAAHLIADVLTRCGRFEEAAPSARESLARFQTLAGIYPDRPEYHNAVATADGLLAQLLGHLNRAEEAAQAQRDMQAARQAAEELRKLPAADQLLDTARPYAEKREWSQAAAELNKGFEFRHRSDSRLCYAASLARLLAGDVEGYAHLAERMPIGRRGRWETVDVLRTCTLHPSGGADPAALVRLAQSAYDFEVNNWSAQNLGLALYRAGKFDEALPRIEEARKLSDWYLFWPALAMCHHQLGRAEEARQWLDQSNEHFRHVTETDPEPLKVTKEPYWQDWAYFEVLLKEANALIVGEKK